MAKVLVVSNHVCSFCFPGRKLNSVEFRICRELELEITKEMCQGTAAVQGQLETSCYRIFPGNFQAEAF